MASFLGKLFGGGDCIRPPGEIFRASCTVSGVIPDSGIRIYRSGAGVSPVSHAEAEVAAQTAAQRNLQRALAGAERELGAYAYAVNRAAEPQFEVLGSEGGGTPAARISVNSYGALVLNAPRALFVDVDTGGEGGPGAAADATAAQSLAGLIQRRPELGFRVYRTHAGWRYLCTTHEFDPCADATRAVLEELGADPKYRVLCRAQKCFRARLTPKPWRAGYHSLVVSKSSGLARGKFDRYVEKTNGFATAQLVSTIGNPGCMPALEVIRDYHDRWTQAGSGKPLA